MISEKYSKYKYSYIEWIGEIPEHWIVRRIKDCLTFKIGGTPSTKIDEYFEGENIWVSISDISSNNGDIIYDSSIKISDEGIRDSNVKLIKKGSLLYSFKLSVGLTAFAGCDLYTNEAIASFEPNNFIDLNFLKYVFQTGFENNAKENIYGAKLFNSDLIKFSKFVMPPSFQEQQQIANYLDKQTNKIDSIIAKNEELIQLLEEKRVALINQVVTKGLNLDVPMNDSGVEWIGGIPEHWECRKINTLSSVSRGASPRPIDDPIYFDDNGEYSWVRISDVTSSNKYLEQTTEKLSTLGKSLSVPIEPGNIFVSIAATVGKPIIANIKCCIHDGFVYFKNLNLNPEYLFYIFAGGEAYKGLGKLGTQLNLNTETIGMIYIPVPPEGEQSKIIKFLDEEIDKVYKTIDKVQENINLLTEYKTSLIHHVVTGKIDVRGEEI